VHLADFCEANLAKTVLEIKILGKSLIFNESIGWMYRQKFRHIEPSI
jgi:hypothetical protein